MKIKVCGMKYAENIQAVVELEPDYLGFIFYDKSPRFALTELDEFQLSNLPKHITKVGVFVNEQIANIQKVCGQYGINTIQLHGNESPEYCSELMDLGFVVIKAFGVDGNFDFETLNPYINSCNYFLFDTKTEHHGGSGKQFNWSLLKDYQLNIPYFLSGGIGLGNLDSIKLIEDNRLVAIDVNSRFEIKPGIKNISALESLFKEIKDEI